MMDVHKVGLNKLCRLCGNQAQAARQKRPAKLCATYAKDISDVYGVDINHDSAETHPRKLCSLCYYQIINTKRNRDSDSYVVIDITHIESMWVPHSHQCIVCKHIAELSKGSRAKRNDPPQSERVPLLFEINSSNIFLPSEQTNGQTNIMETSRFDIVNMTPLVENTFICSLCKHIFDTNSVKTNCGHYFCAKCLSDVFTMHKKNTVICPSCPAAVKYQDVQQVDDRFKLQIVSLLVRCRRCDQTTKFACIRDHLCSDKDNNIITPSAVTPVPPPACSVTTPVPKYTRQICTIKSCIKRSAKSPLSKEEEQLHTHLTRRKLHFSADKATIKCKTGGQVNIIVIIINLYIYIYIVYKYVYIYICVF